MIVDGYPENTGFRILEAGSTARITHWEYL